MAVTSYDTALNVYRHVSDNQGKNCGRACAQMIIASLYLGGKNPETPDTNPVPVTQEVLKSLETYQNKHEGDDGPGKWFTFPDELVGLLNSNKQLRDLQRANWRIAHYKASSDPRIAEDRLLEDIAVALMTSRMPAILNIQDKDHWVVVWKVSLYANLKLYSLQYFDPAPESSETGQHPIDHTYKDACNDVADYWVRNTNAALANLELKIGNNAPTTYKDHCLAVIYDDQTPQLAKLAKALKKKPKKSKVMKSESRQMTSQTSTLGLTPQQAVVSALHQVADLMDLDELRAFLSAGSQARVWRVKDIDLSGEEYVLSLVSNSHSRRAVLAVCNPETYEVSRFRMTTQNPYLDSLAALPESEPLWWSRSVEDHFWQPFFPFQRDLLATGPRYRRVVDSVYFESQRDPRQGA